MFGDNNASVGRTSVGVATLANYEKIKLLGHGASGEVWLCREIDTQFEFAAKISPCTAEDARSIEIDMFINEVHAAESLQHSGIVRILDHWVTDDSVCIAIEVMHHGTLANHITPGELLPMGRLIKIARRLATIMDFAARNGFLHGDLKPGNIFLGASAGKGVARIKIGDFGSAKRLTAAGIDSSRLPGTIGYMSPEHLRQEPLTGASDIYSFGATLYRLLTGRLPRLSSSKDGVIPVSHLSPSILRAETPLALERIILRCLSTDPASRPSWDTIKTVLQDIRCHGRPVRLPKIPAFAALGRRHTAEFEGILREGVAGVAIVTAGRFERAGRIYRRGDILNAGMFVDHLDGIVPRRSRYVKSADGRAICFTLPSFDALLPDCRLAVSQAIIVCLSGGH